MLFLPIFLYSLSAAEGLKCFSCASSEYKLVLERSKAFRSSRTAHFDTMCDEEVAVQQLAPVENCHSSCITIYEPQYFGGIQLLDRPYLYIRGCADRIFESMERRPREIDYLHRAPVCIQLQLSQIYPQVTENEMVEVCSCTTNGCNYQTAPGSSSSLRQVATLSVLLVYFSFL